MAYLLSLLPILACPLMMGLMMWLMMGSNKAQAGKQADQTDARAPGKSMNTPQTRSMGGFDICLNWRVVAGLAVVGLGTWVVAPNLVWATVPVLLVLACPLSMLFMMRGMGSAQCATQTEQEYRPRAKQLAQLHARNVALTREIAEMESASDATARPVEVDGRGNDVHVHEHS